MFGVVVRDLILLFSAFTAGIAVYLAFINTRAWYGGGFAYGWAYALSRAGYAGAVLLIGEAVYQQPFIPSSWRAWVYILCLAAGGVGFLGIARDQRSTSHGKWKRVRG